MTKSERAYTLQRLSGKRIPRTWNYVKLKKYIKTLITLVALDPLAGAQTESSLGPGFAFSFCTSSLFCILDGCSPPSEGISRSRRQLLALV
ncbi:hypothetical protein P8452_47967 [Trifolium repens]|nr:hypothetical protein P8452_47967 [Trifolium repens]